MKYQNKNIERKIKYYLLPIIILNKIFKKEYRNEEYINIECKEKIYSNKICTNFIFNCKKKIIWKGEKKNFIIKCT